MKFLTSCPTPLRDHAQIMLAHGGGGRLMQDLLDRLIRPAFHNPLLASQHDGAVMEVGGRRLAFTSDSYVVQPLFFPGGDIGTLAVNGTINDLAMCGAQPRWLSASFIIEEGLAMESLKRVIESMRTAASAAGVEIVTGDTKVVDKGKGDGLFINTAGIGVVEHTMSIAPSSIRAGDTVLLSGDVGRHGMTIMSVREGLQFESTIESDCAPLVSPVLALLQNGIEVHCLRDLTRGGLASGLNEISSVAELSIEVEEGAIPVREEVRGACEILGLDPAYVANEGRFIAFVPATQARAALEILRRHPITEGACQIGTVGSNKGFVTMRSAIGATRILDLLSGEQLPRIC